MMTPSISPQSLMIFSAAWESSCAAWMPWFTADCSVWTTSRRKSSSGSAMGVGSTIGLRLEVLTTLERIRHLEPHALDQRVDFGHELLARFLVRPPLEAPLAVALSTW